MKGKDFICPLISVIIFIAIIDVSIGLSKPLLYLSILFSILIIWNFWKGRFKKEVEVIINFLQGFVRNDFKNSGLISINNGSLLKTLTTEIINLADTMEERTRELKREKETLENIFNNMKEGVLIVGRDNRILFINDGLKDILRLKTLYSDMTATEILREAELISIIEELRNREFLKDFHGKGISGRSISKEVSLRDGRYLSVTAGPVEYIDGDRNIIMTFHDITRLKRLEEVRRDFVANVAHEIKTPITAIKGFAETLIDGAIEDRENAIKFLEIIKRHSERLNSLVSDLLTLSAIEQGEIKLNITEVKISEVIDSIFTLMEEKARSKGLYLKKEVQDNIIIRADRERLFQILLNLVDNGIKFTDEGGVTVRVEASSIYVEDTGCGIEKKHLPRLGERFYRVDRARSRELGGTGLGLAIVKHLVRAHGWTMDIESTPGKGTKVKIEVRGQ